MRPLAWLRVRSSAPKPLAGGREPAGFSRAAQPASGSGFAAGHAWRVRAAGHRLPSRVATRFVTRDSRSRAGSRDPASSLRAPPWPVRHFVRATPVSSHFTGPAARRRVPHDVDHLSFKRQSFHHRPRACMIVRGAPATMRSGTMRTGYRIRHFFGFVAIGVMWLENRFQKCRFLMPARGVCSLTCPP